MKYRLRYLRVLHCYTQAQIAAFLGISRPTYTLYESGKREPTKTSLLKLADLYHVSIDYLMGR